MSLYAIGVILLSALMHAVWNYLVKKTDDALSSLLWINIICGGVCLIVYPMLWNPLEVSRPGLLWVVVESVFMTGYYVSLAAAYRIGDLSLVYPISRGAAPIFTLAFLAGIMGEEQVTALGVAGIGFIVAGIGVMNLLLHHPDRKPNGSRRPAPGAAMGLVTGLFITAYYIAAKYGRMHMGALEFNMLNTSITGVILGAWSFSFHPRPKIFRAMRRFPLRVSIAAALMFFSYYLALYAMDLGNVSYIVPLRNFSVIVSAGLGICLLKEKQAGIKAAGAALIFAGVLAIAYA